MTTDTPTLQTLLAPLTVADFQRGALHRHAVHSTGRPDRYQTLFNSKALERLVNAGRDASHVRLYRSDTGFVAGGTPSQTIQHLRSGAAIVVEEAEHWDVQLGSLAERLSAELDEPTRINIYATSPNAPGFPLHADTHDVLVLHVEGKKRWTVCAPTLPNPLYHPSLHPQTPPSQIEPYLDVTLVPGDTLYIPRGHWHRAEAVDGPSLHLTVAVFAATGVDLMHYLVDRLHQSDSARMPFAVSPGPALRDASHVPDTHHAQVDVLRHELDHVLCQPALLADFRQWRMAHRSLRQPLALMSHMHPKSVNGPVRVRTVGGWVSESSDGVSVHIPGRTLWFPSSTLPLLRRLWSGAVCTVAELAALVPDADPELAQRIVDGLFAEGLLVDPHA
ncbi:MAG: hypothetical protein ACJAZO_001090 [Myxococcota bacterium]|jgi:hypothetical protein